MTCKEELAQGFRHLLFHAATWPLCGAKIRSTVNALDLTAAQQHIDQATDLNLGERFHKLEETLVETFEVAIAYRSQDLWALVATNVRRLT